MPAASAAADLPPPALLRGTIDALGRHEDFPNGPSTVLQDLAGHKHLTTTMRYMHVVKGAKEDAIKALNRPGGGDPGARPHATTTRTGLTARSAT